jgi:hypothetical protein
MVYFWKYYVCMVIPAFLKMFISQEITAKSFSVTICCQNQWSAVRFSKTYGLYIHVVVLKMISKAGNAEKEYKKLFCKFNKINFLMNSSYV